MSLLLAALVAFAAGSSGTLLVLPPDSADSVEAGRTAEAVSDLLPHALAFLGAPVVERADRLLGLEALELPSVPLTRASAVRLAEAVGASRLVVGKLELKGDQVELALRLLDIERGTLSTPFISSGALQALPQIVDALAWDLALAGARHPLRTRAELEARRRVPPLEALREYAAGVQAADATLRVRSLKRALQLAPSFDEARLELGRQLLATRELEAAYHTLSGIQDASLARAARFAQGRALLDMGRYRDAAFLYAGLVAGDPTAAALNNHALALLRQSGAPLRASDVIRKALEIAPGDPDLAFNLGFALLFEDDAAAAGFWQSGVVKASPRDVHARVVLSWALRRAGRVEEADETWRAVAALTPALESLQKEDLTRRFERTLPSERRLARSESARSRAELAAAHLGRADKALVAGETETAARELALAAFSDPYNPRVHTQLARLARDTGNSDKAVSELRIALWCRDDSALRVELASLLKDLGRDREALAEAAAALKADPTNAAARRIVEGR